VRGLCQFDSDNIPRPAASSTSPAYVHNTLAQLRSSISRRIQFRRSVRNSGVLPSPADSASAAPSSHDGEDDDANHYVNVEHGTDRQRPDAASLESNSMATIAARYADHRVPRPSENRAEGFGGASSLGETAGMDSSTATPTVSAQNEDDTARTLTTEVSSPYDTIDVTLPVTRAPARPVTSISTTGSVGGATATGVDADYLPVTVDDQQKSQVSCSHVSEVVGKL